MNLVKYYTVNKWLTGILISVISILGIIVIFPLKTLGFNLLYTSIVLRFIYVIILIIIFSKQIDLRKVSNIKLSIRVLFMVFVALLPFLIQFVQEPLYIVKHPIRLLGMLSVGLYEELISRMGILVFLAIALLKQNKNVKGALVISSILFGSIHIFNLLVGAGILQVLAQVASATLAGFILGMVLIATRNIWIVCIIHCLYNTQNYIDKLSTTFGELGRAFIGFGLTLLLFGLVILFFRREDWKIFAEKLLVSDRRLEQ